MVQLMRVAACKFWDFQKHLMRRSRLFDDYVYDYGDDECMLVKIDLGISIACGDD